VVQHATLWKPSKSCGVRPPKKRRWMNSVVAAGCAFEFEVWSKGPDFSYSRHRLQSPSNPNASASRICSRARKSLVFSSE